SPHMNEPLFLLARILLAAIFLISGVRKALGFSFMSVVLAGKGFPLPDIVLVLTIALEIGGGLMLIPNWNARYAALALALFTMVAGALFHAFWHVWGGPPAQFNNELNHFLKNVAITGGLLLVAGWPQNAPRRV